MKLLITGAGGQLGHEMALLCQRHGDELIALRRADLDIGDRDQALGTITALRPDAVINCGAWTAVDACETDHDRAYRDNALAVRWLADACGRIGAHLVQVSTDYVFDGTLDRPYTEWDAPNPQSVYGRSKLGGEREAGLGASIVRTSWVCGEHGNNMVKTVLKLAAAGTEMSFVSDQIGHPTFTADLAPVLRMLAVGRRPGVHHVTNQGAVSWYQFVQSILEVGGFPPDLVRPISTAELDPPRPAARPFNGVLDNAALRLAGDPPMRSYVDALTDLVTCLRGR